MLFGIVKHDILCHYVSSLNMQINFENYFEEENDQMASKAYKM